jgi:hypothetical protein
MPKELFIHRYLLIINRLQKSPADFLQINNYLQRESEIEGIDYTLSLRTFQREIKEIEKLDYNIKYDKKQKVYSIQPSDNNEMQTNRMLEAVQTIGLLKTGSLYKKHIQFENRKPQGLHHLSDLLKAIQNCFVIKLDYQKFYEEEPCIRELYPLCLKECQSRWYLIAKDTYDDFVKPYALDRIFDFEITKKQFSKNERTIKDDYEHCFGIIKPPAGKPHKVILSFEAFQGQYVKTFPLHSSQTITKEDKKYLTVELNVFITYDLIMELLSYGSTLKVLQPKTLANKIATNYKAGLKNYT